MSVSRETSDRLDRYVELLLKWQQTINLIGPSTVNDVWGRHILDCAQLIRFLPKKDHYTILDLGSGAGLPGLVLAILGASNVKLIESNLRKCIFLREAARVTGVNVEILNSRIEDLNHVRGDIILARGLAPLCKLLEIAKPVSNMSTVFLLLKGKGLKKELTDLNKKWNIKIQVYPSLSEVSSSVVKLELVFRENFGSNKFENGRDRYSKA